MNNHDIISERLKQERLRLGLKQTDVIKAIDVAIATFSNYENGKRSPDADFLLKLGALGYDIGYVVTGKRLENGMAVLLPDEQEWLDVYRALGADDRDRLIKMAKSLI